MNVEFKDLDSVIEYLKYCKEKNINPGQLNDLMLFLCKELKKLKLRIKHHDH
jgi:hypothetical protein